MFLQKYAWKEGHTFYPGKLEVRNDVVQSGIFPVAADTTNNKPASTRSGLIFLSLVANILGKVFSKETLDNLFSQVWTKDHNFRVRTVFGSGFSDFLGLGFRGLSL